MGQDDETGPRRSDTKNEETGRRTRAALTTLVTAGGEEHLEVMFTVFPALELRKEERGYLLGGG